MRTEPTNLPTILVGLILSGLVQYPFTSYVLWVIFGIPLQFWTIFLVSLFVPGFVVGLTIVFWILGAVGIHYPLLHQVISVLTTL
jgi:hypothetical protein